MIITFHHTMNANYFTTIKYPVWVWFMNKLFIKMVFLKFVEVLCYSSDPKIFYLGLVGSLYFMYVGGKRKM